MSKLSSAFLRKGRIDKQIYVGPIDNMEDLKLFIRSVLSLLDLKQDQSDKVYEDMFSVDNLNKTAAELKDMINTMYFNIKKEEYAGVSLFKFED
jgi:SpoVK/Ycf46/Vps4 family AAA+-type ATPase